MYKSMKIFGRVVVALMIIAILYATYISLTYYSGIGV